MEDVKLTGEYHADVNLLLEDTKRLEFLVRHGGRYHFRERYDGTWAAMDCGSGLTFIARDCAGYREAVDAARDREAKRNGL